MPTLGGALARQVDDALELLRSVPFEELQRRGWHLQPNNFNWPLNDVPFLRENPDLWTVPRVPLGIDWDLDGQEELLNELAEFAPELDDVPDRPGAPFEFAWDQAPLTAADAYVYYGLMRRLRPKRVVEVGSGWSSRLLARAIAVNQEVPRVTLVEPLPDREILAGLPEGWNLTESLVQDVELALFEELQAGDVLFYDGSHCARAASDVNWMLFEVLPRLRTGVWVHFHDIWWPTDYHPTLILDDGLSWNEQYVLQALLMHSQAFRVRLALYLIWTLRTDSIEGMFPRNSRGQSVWIEKVA
jgi:Methyltransferase domain